MKSCERDPQHRRVFVQRAKGAVRSEPLQDGRTKRNACHESDGQSRVGAEPGDSREEPEELVYRHGLSHQASARAAQKTGARSGPRTRAVFATTSASTPFVATTETSSRPVCAGRPVRGSIRWWCSPSPHLRRRVLLVAAPWSRRSRVTPARPTGHPAPSGPTPPALRSPPRLAK